MPAPSPLPAGWFALALTQVLLVATAAVVLLLVAAWPWTGFETTFVPWVGILDPWLLPPLALAFGSATWLAGRWRWLGKLLASGCLGWAWASYRVLTMGDGHWWRQAAAEGTVTWAEPLGSHLLVLLHRVGGPAALEWLPVALGVLATWVWLSVTDGLLPAGARRPAAGRAVAALLWLSTGAGCVFFHRYVEQTQLGIPLLLLGLAALRRRAQALVAAPPRTAVPARDLYRGAGALLLAALLHLQYAGMFAAAVGAAWLLGLRQGAAVSLRQLAGLAALVAAGAGGTVALFVFGPCTPFVGSVGGGADGQLLVSFVDAQGGWAGAGALLSAEHLALVAFLLVFAVPAALPFAVEALGAPRRVAAALDPPAVAAGAAWVLFVATFGFDLGWPTDADLMLSMSVALSWLVATWLLPGFEAASTAVRTAGCGVLLVGVFLAWSVITPLVRPMGTNVSQANSPAASLRLAGVPLGDGPGPFVVEAEVGARFELHAEGPPGAEFWILRGVPSPACEGHPYGGVADLVPNLQPEAFVHVGVFDAAGRAVVPFVVQPLADGALPGVQMLVFDRAAAVASTTSAAFYFRRR